MRFLSIETGKPISKIGLGTWQFGTGEWGYGSPYAAEEAGLIVRRAIELGVTLFDTAEVYGFGRSERILGEALGADRKSAFIATKIMPVLPSASAVQRHAAASAGRLDVPAIDLYQVHQPSPLVPVTTLMHGMRSLQRSGLVTDVGVSNYTLKRWRAAEAALGSRVLANQVRYSLVSRAPERDLLPFAAGSGHAIIAYSPLGQGLLSGRYDRDHRPANLIRNLNPRFLPANLDRAAGLLATLREIAGAHGASPAQIALAWVIRHPAVAAIPGASSVAQLESNAAAAEIDLTDSEDQALRDASDQFQPVTGAAALPRLAQAAIRR